jgi:hypothetical protein
MRHRLGISTGLALTASLIASGLNPPAYAATTPPSMPLAATAGSSYHAAPPPFTYLSPQWISAHVHEIRAEKPHKPATSSSVSTHWVGGRTLATSQGITAPNAAGSFGSLTPSVRRNTVKSTEGGTYSTNTATTASGATTTPTAPFTECPAVGADASCGLLIHIMDAGAEVLQDS